ncbi:MAG: Cellobiose 2-epimerase [Phycisphaerae bacterium]|nr:Cellobiose 2-epimerase [Phycisphaerae bacterium]
MPSFELAELAQRCRRELDESVVPFWMRHSLDRECGGYFTALDRDGSVYDDRKYMWLQGREVWMFARLYNRWDRRQEYLDAAALGARFIRSHGRDAEGRVHFCLNRQGVPVAYQRKPFAAVFVMLGLLEFGVATGDQPCIAEAEGLFWKIVAWIGDPTLLGRMPPPPGSPRMSQLACQMMLMAMAMELLAVRDDPRVRQALAGAVRDTKLHYDASRRVFMENAALDGTSLRASPDGRLCSPGHSIEMAWHLLHALEFLPPDEAAAAMALEAIEGSMQFGWDEQYGGLLYFRDVEGRPVLFPEHFMKLWWVHTEASYALVLAHLRTGEERWLTWLEKLSDYAWRLFPDPQHGEWFGYCDRQGNRTHDCKGGSYKGFFHVPRFLMTTAQLIERNSGR